MGFPIGKVAQTLRKILYPGLTEQLVEAIVVCLMAHLLVEGKINELLYQWLKQDAPMGKKDKVSRAEKDLWKNIVRMGFVNKYSFVEPFFSMRFPRESKNVRKLNTLRNLLFHGRTIADAKFEDKPLAEENTVERIFLAAQDISMSLDQFKEMIDIPHANADRWRKQLETRAQRKKSAKAQRGTD